MSMQTLERAILAAAKVYFKNPKLRLKDIREWRTSAFKPQDGEVLAFLDDPGCYVAILKENDRGGSA